MRHERCQRDRDGFCFRCQAGPIDRCPDVRDYSQAEHDAALRECREWRRPFSAVSSSVSNPLEK